MARNLSLIFARNELSLKKNGTQIFPFNCSSLGLSSKVDDEMHYKTLIYVIKPSKVLNAKEKKNRFLRLQRENNALFGPLLKSEPEKKKEIKKGKLKIGSEVINLNGMRGESYFKPKPKRMSNDEEGNVYNLGDNITDFPMMNPRRMNESRLPYDNVIKPTIIDDIKSYPSVTRILNETMSEQSRMALEKWKNSMIEKLGEEGFAQYQANLFKIGKDLHTNIAELMQGKDERELSILPENEGHWKSLEKLLPEVKDVALIEYSLYHPHLKYKGVVDCVAVYRNKLLVIDWKTSKKVKSSIYSLFDNPIQVIAYLGALNFDKRFNRQVDGAAVIVAYENGSPAHVHLLDQHMCLKCWKQWLLRLDQFFSKSC